MDGSLTKPGSGSGSPTSEDLLLCIEKEKLELDRLKRDLESYKAQNLRRRHPPAIDHEWDDALCNLKQVSESKLVASKEVSGKLLFKTSRDTLRDALQNNMKGGCMKGSGLALISTSTASLQRASQVGKAKNLQVAPRQEPRQDNIDLFNYSQFYEGSVDESDIESSSSPPLQYISLPSQFETALRNPSSTQEEPSKDTVVLATSTNGSYLQYRNSIAVDQTSFHNNQASSFSNQPDPSPTLEQEKACSLPCSPYLGNYESDFDNDLFEDLSQADDFMSLIGKLEGIEEEEEEEEEETLSEKEFELSLNSRPISRLGFRPSSLLSSNSTLSVPTAINSPNQKQLKTSPLQSTPLDSLLIENCQAKSGSASSLSTAHITFDSFQTPVFSRPLVKAKSVRFKSPVAASIASIGSVSSDELDEGFDQEQSPTLTTIFSAPKPLDTEETTELDENDADNQQSADMETNPNSLPEPVNSHSNQNYDSDSNHSISNDDVLAAPPITNQEFSVARRVAETGSNRSSVVSQVLVSREETFSISRFLAEAFNEHKLKEAESTFIQPESSPTIPKPSPKNPTQYFTSTLITSSQYKRRSSLVEGLEDSLVDSPIPTLSVEPEFSSPQTPADLNPFSYDVNQSNVPNTNSFSSQLIQAGSSSPKLPHITSNQEEALPEISVALSPLNEYQPSPLVDTQLLPPVTINQMVHNAFFNQRDSYTTPKVRPLSFNLEQGDMTVTPRRIKERKTYLLQPENGSNGSNSDPGFSTTVSPDLSTAVGSPLSKSGLGKDNSDSPNPTKTDHLQPLDVATKPLRTSFSHSGLRDYSDTPSKDIHEVSTLPNSKCSRLGVEMAASLDADIEHSQSYSGLGSSHFTTKFPFRTIGLRRNPGTTNSLRTKLFKFGSNSNLSLVSKFDRGAGSAGSAGSAVAQKDTNHSLVSTPVRRNTILQRLRKIVSRDTNEIRRLYQFDDSKLRTLIASGEEISAKLLSSRNAYVLEINDTLFLWFGKHSSDIKQRQASRFAGTLLRNTNPDHSAHQTIRVEFEGSEHTNFTSQFPDWEASLGSEPHLVDYVMDPIAGNPHFAEVYNRTWSRPWTRCLVNLDDSQHVSLKVWLMRGATEHIELPTTEHGIFFSSEAYVMLYHYRDSHHADHHVVFYWIGRNSKRAREPILPPSKVALDNQNEALMVQILQGHESEVFMKLFNGLIVVRWGGRKPLPNNPNSLKLATEFNSHPGAHSSGDRGLYHISGTTATNVKAEQTTCSSRYLCSGHSFLLIAKGKVFVWHGIGSFLFERLAAVMIAKRIAPPGSKIQEVREKLEPRKFWSGFGSERLDYADAIQWARKPFLQGQYQVRLFQLSHSIPTGLSVHELSPFHQLDLLPDHAYILDTYFDLFLWCRYDSGPRLFSLTNDPTSKSATLFACLHLCMEYTRHIDRTEARPFKLKPIMVLPGHEPLEFVAAFSGWDAGDHARSSRFKPPTLKRKASPRALPVEYLLSKFASQPQLNHSTYSKNSHSLTGSMHVF